MNIEFAVVPPGGGGIAYTFTMELAAPPIQGDFIFKEDGEGKTPGYATFIVIRRLFFLDESSGRVVVEIEPARSAQESLAHRRFCVKYSVMGKQIQDLSNIGH